MRHAEHEEQKIVAECLRNAGILFCAIPNGARTSMSVAKRLKAEGLEAGAPDLLIFDPPPVFRGEIPRGVAVEMKAPKGGKPSPAQILWQRRLEERGWVALVCYGADEALKELARLGYRVPH